MIKKVISKISIGKDKFAIKIPLGGGDKEKTQRKKINPYQHIQGVEKRK